ACCGREDAASPHPPVRPGVNLDRRPGPSPGHCHVALVPGQDHRVGVVGGGAEARADIVLRFDEDLIAARLPGGSGELGAEAAGGSWTLSPLTGSSASRRTR